MKSSRPEEDKNIEQNIIKGVKNLFRLNKLKKEINDAAIKGIRSTKIQKTVIEDRIIRNNRNLFEHKE